MVDSESGLTSRSGATEVTFTVGGLEAGERRAVMREE